MMEESTLLDALGDVRRAFRLLWFYQERIFDIVRTIAGEFKDLKFYYWESHNAARFDGGSNPLSRSPWYAVPFMNMSYLYRSDGDATLHRPGEWLLDVRVISDSGYDVEQHYREWLDPSGFAGIVETESKLNLYALSCTEEISGTWFRSVWEQVAWPDPDGTLQHDADLPINKIGMSFNIADLGDKEAVLGAVREFQKTASTALGVEIA